MAETAPRAILVLAGVAAFFLSQLPVAPTFAADYDVGSIHITQPWSRATLKGITSGAAYMTITNKGTAPDKVTCVSDDASAQCQIHTMTMEGGVMKMRPVEGGLEIKPGETVKLAPLGLHLMFRDLKHPLEQGKTIKATLKFENAGIFCETSKFCNFSLDLDFQCITVCISYLRNVAENAYHRLCEGLDPRPESDRPN
jgi:periplasmic copper chaperone A